MASSLAVLRKTLVDGKWSFVIANQPTRAFILDSHTTVITQRGVMRAHEVNEGDVLKTFNFDIGEVA